MYLILLFKKVVMKLKVTLSPYSRKSKKEINPAVENELISSMYTREIIIADLAKATGENGHTWCHAIFSGKRNKKNFLSTQLLVADFDDRINYGDAVDRLTEYGLGVAFAYTTFSDHLPIGSAQKHPISRSLLPVSQGCILPI